MQNDPVYSVGDFVENEPGKIWVIPYAEPGRGTGKAIVAEAPGAGFNICLFGQVVGWRATAENAMERAVELLNEQVSQ